MTNFLAQPRHPVLLRFDTAVFWEYFMIFQDVVDYEREINNNERSILEITPPPGAKKKKEKKKKPILVEQEVTFRNMMKSIYNMPVELATLCLGDLCNWVMIVTLIIYYTGLNWELNEA